MIVKRPAPVGAELACAPADVCNTTLKDYGQENWGRWRVRRGRAAPGGRFGISPGHAHLQKDSQNRSMSLIALPVEVYLASVGSNMKQAIYGIEKLRRKVFVNVLWDLLPQFGQLTPFCLLPFQPLFDLKVANKTKLVSVKIAKKKTKP